MSKWSHIEGIIKCINIEGLEYILNEQEFIESPWEHYVNPYPSLSGSEGDAHFCCGEENELSITGDLRDVDSIPSDMKQIINDFEKIIGLTEGKGYIEYQYDGEGTLVIDYYEELDIRIFPQPDGWDRYYEKILKNK